MPSSAPDALALPPRAPEMERWRDEPLALLQTALYSLADLSDAELLLLQDTCESKCETQSRGECVKPPSRWKFAGEDLAAIAKYHIDLANGRQFDPNHFIVAVSSSWKTEGVLFVTLDSDADECVPDSFWVKAEGSGLCFVNILIGESGWHDEKKAHALSK